MDDLQELPDSPGSYSVYTRSGTEDVTSRRREGVTWERRPGAAASFEGTYDMEPVPVILGEGWVVGGNGSLTVSDETYLTGQMWHVTGRIITITSSASGMRTRL